MRRNRIFIVMVLFVILVFLGGCGNNESSLDELIVNGETNGFSTEVISEGDTFNFFNIPELWYNFCIYAKRWAPVIIVASALIGWIICDVFKKITEVRKWAIDVMIIKIPAFTFIAVYVFSFLYGMMNF